VTERLQEVIKVLTPAYALIVVVIVFSLLGIRFVVIEKKPQCRNTTLAGNLDNLFSNDPLAVGKSRTAEKYDKRRQYAAFLILDGASVKANTCDGMLTARIRASADLDLDIVVEDQVRIFFLDHLFESDSNTVAAGDSKITCV